MLPLYNCYDHRIHEKFLFLADTRGSIQESQSSGLPGPQTSTVRTSRTVVLIISLVAVALATKTAPKAKVVINVPPSFVKNGSMVFFNKDFHGRLILSQSLKERFQKIQQFGRSWIMLALSKFFFLISK